MIIKKCRRIVSCVRDTSKLLPSNAGNYIRRLIIINDTTNCSHFIVINYLYPLMKSSDNVPSISCETAIYSANLLPYRTFSLREDKPHSKTSQLKKRNLFVSGRLRKLIKTAISLNHKGNQLDSCSVVVKPSKNMDLCLRLTSFS